MIFTVAQLVRCVNRFMSLHPGDIIGAGTPHGAALGTTPPPYLRSCQVMRLGIDGLGEPRPICREDRWAPL